MKYDNGKIYLIRNSVNDLLYVGSTTMSLSQRMAAHRSKAKIDDGRKLYNAMRELGTIVFYIELLENFPCASKDELHARENRHIRTLDTFRNGYNSRNQVADWQEHYARARQYKIENAEAIKQKNKDYADKNKDIIREKRSKLVTCECGRQVKYFAIHKHRKTSIHLKYIEQMQNARSETTEI